VKNNKNKNNKIHIQVRAKPETEAPRSGRLSDYVLQPPFGFHPPWYPGLNSTHFYRVYAFITLIVVALLRTIASDMKTLTSFFFILLFAF